MPTIDGIQASALDLVGPIDGTETLIVTQGEGGLRETGRAPLAVTRRVHALGRLAGEVYPISDLDMVSGASALPAAETCYWFPFVADDDTPVIGLGIRVGTAGQAAAAALKSAIWLASATAGPPRQPRGTPIASSPVAAAAQTNNSLCLPLFAAPVSLIVGRLYFGMIVAAPASPLPTSRTFVSTNNRNPRLLGSAPVSSAGGEQQGWRATLADLGLTFASDLAALDLTGTPALTAHTGTTAADLPMLYLST